MEHNEFYLKVSYALSGCQLVEQELKLYISHALDLIRKRLGHRMPFKMKGDDYENSSLEGLINIFKKLNDNEALIKDLNKFKKERNFLSHQGITHCLDHEGDLLQTTATEMESRMSKIQDESSRLMRNIHEEGSKFRGFLWFEDVE